MHGTTPSIVDQLMRDKDETDMVSIMKEESSISTKLEVLTIERFVTLLWYHIRNNRGIWEENPSLLNPEDHRKKEEKGLI